MKLKAKIVLLFTLVIVLGTAAMGTFATYTLSSKIKDAAVDKLKSDMKLSRSLIESKFPGDWQVQGDKLYKGDTLVNDNTAIVDEIGELTGGTVTIFLGDTRVTTNVKKEDGSRAVGTKVADVVAEQTLKNGEPYFGEAQVVNMMSQTAYEPIKNAGGQVIGMYYVGVPNSVYDQIVDKFRNQVVVFGVAGLVVAVVASYLVAHFNARPLRRLTQVANQVASGDLRVEKLPENRKDELGDLSRSVNGMVDNLYELIGNVSATATQVAASSEELSASTEQAAISTGHVTETIQEVATGAELQLQRTQESELAIEGMTVGIQRIADTSVMVAETSLQSALEAEQGTESIEQAAHQMRMIVETVNEFAAGVNMLEQRSQEIGAIVEVITGIAAQTNLLALNAAIEAARAGEHGKGFAVVADEVRKLAEQSGHSAGRIEQLIQAIQAETSRAMSSMEVVIREVKSGTEVVHVAGDAFHRILTAARQVSEQVQDVTASSQEMSAGSQEVAQAVEEVTRIARGSAGNAQLVVASSEEQLAVIEEISRSAEALSQMALELQEKVGKFKV
ncbi:methyl-accepting chemotaxis protein [Tumebacillus sp. BK434]|uniref:methyl-accepting chemotaxis protein n=1 Tax=Tumebacillus sp. BK434 TaxID=2512169 RepID=UPI0010524B3B|nr:methyl-accepting chemotaxis protein [Tumebacillus sp. BK434]TCP55490.1 methyl-accepting chemotaxis protein [Tumebacillus sp. BK434]